MALVAVGGVLVGRWIAKAAQPKPGAAGDDKTRAKSSGVDAGSVAGAPSDASGAAPVRSGDPFASFECRLGDVIIRHGGGEAWLAGALVLAEDTPTAALFVGPEAGGERAVLIHARPATSIAWLEPLGSGAVVVAGEPPSALEHGGVRFERVCRLPVRIERLGSGAPDVGERAILAEYAGAGSERLVVVAGTAVRAWKGTALENGMYDVLPGGKGTLQDG
jgi:hypothetical protein